VVENSYINFVGFTKYWDVLSDPLFLKSILNTIIIFSVLVVMKFPLLLIVSSLVRESKNKNFFLWIIYLPALIGVFAYAIMYRYLFTYNGMLNDLIMKVFDMKIDFLGNPFFARVVVVVALVWSSLGINVLLLVNGLNRIPLEFMEYAEIEGANTFQKLRYIYIPYSKRLVMTIFLISLIETIGSVVIPLNLTQGGPYQSTYTIGFYMYQQAFQFGDFPKASAAGVLIFAIGLVIVIVLEKRFSYEKDY
jgi:ABC-type sugar transport system permease subunit